jgi:predicted esterase
MAEESRQQPSRDDGELFAEDPAAFGRLTAVPARVGAREPAIPGEYPLGLSAGRDGAFYVPPSYSPERAAALLLCLHGAGGRGTRSIAAMRAQADRAGILLLAPDSRDATWDVLRGGYGPDVAFIDRALALMFDRFVVDPAHLGIDGFSDGASYALSLGIANGDLFTHIVAFSPGFMAPPSAAGSPHIFISHGTRDQVLPIDWCSRRLAPAIRNAGYDVHYVEFDGPHGVPEEIQRQAMDWFLT